MQRDLYIDFAKGIATVSVIFIHTAFWSGQFYVPAEVRSLSLLFDVVLFYALSGITSSGNIDKTFYRLLKLQITYMIFVTLIFFLDYFFKVFGLSVRGMDWLKEFYSIFGEKYVPQNISSVPQWQNLGNWYMHSYTNADTFPVIMGSFWYLKVYFILAVFGALIIRFFPKHISWFIALGLGLTLIYHLFPNYFPTGQVAYVAFYLAVFLIGNRMKGKKVSTKVAAVLYAGVFAALGWVFLSYGKDIFYLFNKNKFPPKIPYIIWISFGIATLFVLYNRLKINRKSVITYIGENAIFFYFAQGISSTLIYFLVDPLHDHLHWGILLPFALSVNLILAYFIAWILKSFDEFIWKFLRILQKKTASEYF